jgi:starch phosphorylase
MTRARPSFQRDLPSDLEGLYDLALDLRWTGSETTDRIWEILDPDAWERTNNPFILLENVSEERLKEVARNEELRKELISLLERRKVALEGKTWYESNYPDRPLGLVAYFSMEFGLSESLPIYSGGLGILAGDHLKTASDLGVPLVGVGLLYQQGYFRQILDRDGSQIEAFPYNDPTTLPVAPVLRRDGSWLRITIPLPGRDLILRLWRAQVGRIDLYLLDSNDPLNSPWDRGITSALYSPGQEKRLIQEIILGMGGWRALEDMGFEVDVCHLNEGHAAFLVFARAASFMRRTGQSFRVALRATRAGNIFTTHTPVEAGFDRFDLSLLKKYAERFADSSGISIKELQSLGRAGQGEDLVTADLAIRHCNFANGVSRLHGQVCHHIFQSKFPRWPEHEVPIGYITNGIHVPSWDSRYARRLWNQGEYYLNAINGEPLNALDNVSDSALWDFRCLSRRSLVEYVRRRLERQLREHNAQGEMINRAKNVLDPNVLTIGLARRFAAYKRPTLLLHDSQRLMRILLDRDRPVQLIVSGKAHPSDEDGKSLVRSMAQFSSMPELMERMIFLEDYDIALERKLGPGIDLWINVPRRYMEACGTSGMKVLVNGGLNLSELDGWWDEAYTPDVGWALGGSDWPNGSKRDAFEANQLYRLLEEEIVPEFYYRDSEGIPRGWIRKVRASMSRLMPRFSSSRMMHEYLEKAYIPAAKAYRLRSSNSAGLASRIEAWSSHLEKGWSSLGFGKLNAEREGSLWRFDVEVYLGELDPKDIALEIYADPNEDQAPIRVRMTLKQAISGSDHGYIYTVSVDSSRPASDFTPRIVPYHPDASIPIEEAHILWHH